VAAFLIEYFFYLVPGFTRLREWLAERMPLRRWLWASRYRRCPLSDL